jgi:ATP-binding cassette subfamily B protein
LTDGRHDGTGDAAAPVAGRPLNDAPPMDPIQLRSTIERHGGRFEIELPTSTRGMRFVIDLPLHALAGDEAGTGRLQGLRAMLVEDGDDAREALQALLGLEGATVLAFGGGWAALAWLTAHDTAQWPDVLICDLSLGDIDGLRVMQTIRQMEADRGTSDAARAAPLPAIALTGHAGEAARSRSALAGFQRHLVKPVAPDELVAQLKALRPAG